MMYNDIFVKCMKHVCFCYGVYPYIAREKKIETKKLKILSMTFIVHFKLQIYKSKQTKSKMRILNVTYSLWGALCLVILEQTSREDIWEWVPVLQTYICRFLSKFSHIALIIQLCLRHRVPK